MIKVNYDNEGNILGFYPDDIDYPSIPTPYIEIDDATYNEVVKNQDKYIVSNGQIIVRPNWDEQLLITAKNIKYAENETKRESFLISGVRYKNILWDSDLEQKINLKVQTDTMNDTETVYWRAMDGVTALECTKADLLAIGELLTTMTTYVWNVKNPQIKTAIANATTVEEVNAIEIIYSLDEMTNSPIQEV